MKKHKTNIFALTICAAILLHPAVYAQNAQSEAAIEFVAGTGPTYPVHPEFPDTDSNDGGVEGSLAIVSVSRFDFGVIPITSATESFDIITDLPNIQVVDLRGTAAGWKVTASVTRFSNGTGDTLPGAEIQIIAGRPNSLSASAAPAQIPNTILTSDGEPIPVVKAASGAGTGLWIMRWYPPAAEEGEEEEGKYIKLDIPIGTATTGSHSATITWVLEITP